jgi:hypothetical protein
MLLQKGNCIWNTFNCQVRIHWSETQPDSVPGRGKPFRSPCEIANIEKFHNYDTVIYCIPCRYFLELCNYRIEGGQVMDYPLSLSVDYPGEKRNRLTNFFRIIVAIPIMILEELLVGTAGLIFLPVLLMILFRKKYPRWWFDWNYGLTKFLVRVSVFRFMMRDEYPSTDDDQAVHLKMSYPDVNQLSRGLPVVKWFLAIPHYIVLYFLFIACFVMLVIAWFAILFTGTFPKGMFDFVLGIMRWELRVYAYAFLLITDKYPPFSLE